MNPPTRPFTVSINQPAYLPWLGYFERIAASDLHIVLDHVQFEKNSFVNRNKIKTAQGPRWLTVPVLTSGLFGRNPIREVLIRPREPWRDRHWKTLRQNYGRAAFFKAYGPFLEQTYRREWEKLVDLNMHLIRFHLEALGIATPLVFSSTMSPVLTKSELVLELCRKAGAKRYLSGVLGRGYLDLEAFAREGIEVEFQDFVPAEYGQLHGPFEKNLAALDLLMNHGPEGSAIMRTSRSSTVDT